MYRKDVTFLAHIKMLEGTDDLESDRVKTGPGGSDSVPSSLIKIILWRALTKLNV